MSVAIDRMLSERPDLWRANRAQARVGGGVPSGLVEFDALLPDGGWPIGALCEFLSDLRGIGEVSLVLPALARLSQEDRHIAWVAAPLDIYAPALAAAGVDLKRCMRVARGDGDGALWAAEQLLRSGACAAVLLWSDCGDTQVLRRLQLAAETGQSLCFLYRPLAAQRQSSPAALRLRASDGHAFEILKCRGSQWQHGRGRSFPIRHVVAGPALSAVVARSAR